MVKTRVSKDTKGNKVTLYLSKCNDCERDIQLSCSIELTDKQLDELHERMLCTSCLRKKEEKRKK